MAKSLVKQIQEAAQKGDLEAVQKLSARLAAPVPKPKPKPTTAPRRTRTKPEPTPPPPPESDWMAPSARVDNKSGLVRREARRQSMAGNSHPNTFVDRGGVLDRPLTKVEKELAKQAATPRPGESGLARPRATKMTVPCDGCGREFQVYPSEVGVAHDDSGSSYDFYKCQRCERRGK